MSSFLILSALMLKMKTKIPTKNIKKISSFLIRSALMLKMKTKIPTKNVFIFNFECTYIKNEDNKLQKKYLAHPK